VAARLPGQARRASHASHGLYVVHIVEMHDCQLAVPHRLFMACGPGPRLDVVGHVMPVAMVAVFWLVAIVVEAGKRAERAAGAQTRMSLERAPRRNRRDLGVTGVGCWILAPFPTVLSCLVWLQASTCLHSPHGLIIQQILLGILPDELLGIAARRLAI
jgi:hypothetical protein